MRLFLTWLVPMALFASWFGWRDARVAKAQDAALVAVCDRPRPCPGKWDEPTGTLHLFPGHFLDYTVIGNSAFCRIRR